MFMRKLVWGCGRGLCFLKKVLRSSLLVMCPYLLQPFDQCLRLLQMFQFMFRKHFLIESNFIVGISPQSLFGLLDDIVEIVVAQQQNAQEIASGLVPRFEFYRRAWRRQEPCPKSLGLNLRQLPIALPRRDTAPAHR